MAPNKDGEVVSTSVRGEGQWTLADVADLVERQGYNAEYAARRTGFTLAQVQSFLSYRQAKEVRRSQKRTAPGE